MLQDAKPLCEFECVCNLGTVHRFTSPTHAHVYVCAFVLTVAPAAAESRAETPLEARLWQPGARGREEGREAAREEGEGVDEVSKDSCIAELYLLQSKIWTVSVLRFNKSTEVK